MSKPRVPITIVTGFLGSGKTTLINYILKEVGGSEKLAIVKNEIGDVAVDSKIIMGKNIVMKELLNGCVCCTLVGELEDSLKELVDKVKPDRIIIEASGAANPAILAVNLDRLNFVRRDLIVTVIDAVNFGGYKDKSIVTRMQQRFTDMIVVNKVGEVDEDRVEDILDDIYEIRPDIPVVKTVTGRVDPDVLFGTLSQGESIRLSKFNKDEMHREHIHEDEIQSFSYKSGPKIQLEKKCLQKLLDGLSEEYYRVKGFVKFAGEQDFTLVNFVCGRTQFDAVSSRSAADIAKEGNRVAFIGKRVGRYKEKVLERMKDCQADL